MSIKVGVYGAAGRMGKAILAVCHAEKEITVVAAIEHEKSPMIGLDAGEVAGLEPLGVVIDCKLQPSNSVDVMIDFTRADAVVEHIKQCRELPCRMVIGTTGLSEAEQQILEQSAKEIAIVFAPNMSVGMNLCFKLLQTVASTLGQSADIEITEAHHRHKKDSPSGSALKMGEIIAETLGQKLSECALYGRQGISDQRDKATIAFHSIRAGDIVGEHTALFAVDGEQIQITHKASSREAFATGAVSAVKWLVHKQQGLFSMQDILGFSDNE